MILVIRIKGQVNIPVGVAETLHRVRIRRKYSCVILKESKETSGILKKIRNFVAYGKISDESLSKLILSRAKSIEGDKKKKKFDVKKIIEEIKESGRSSIIKPYFRLHPPRKGIKSKLHYPKGVLGDHGKEINKLLDRML